jgi:methylated-DNA-[protein]-cysteine S-methyltransferase
VRRLEFGPLPKDAHPDIPEDWPAILQAVVAQLEEYFAKARTDFDVPLDLDTVTDFQREVYAELSKVPHGRVTTYGELAEAVGRAELARAVGQAVGANPVPILIPCHRVVAAEGRLGGFSGGLAVKAALLHVEGLEVEGHTELSRIRPEVLRLDL